MTSVWDINISPASYPGAALTLPLGSVIPKATGGIAKWNKIPRPRRRTMTEFDTEDPIELTFSVMLDAFPDGSVEDLIRRIWGWGARNGLPFQPTILWLAGPVPYADLPYVLSGIEEMDTVERRDDGIRCRQELKLTMLEYVAPGIAPQAPSPAAASVARIGAPTTSFKISVASGKVSIPGASPPPRTYTVKKNDTLSGIAAKMYNDVTRWPAIANANNLRDSRSIKPGQVLKIP